MSRQPITIEGYTTDEILEIPSEQISDFIFCDHPIVFRVGTAEILGEFCLNPDTLTVELAHVDGGGEGILPNLWVLIERIAKQQKISQIEWIVYAVNCAKPNPRLRRLLIHKGFVTKVLPVKGDVYYFLDEITENKNSS